MDELKACPFCGKEPAIHANIAICVNDDCEQSDYWTGLEVATWNTRPIEDELNRRIAELESIVDKFADAGTELYHRVKAEWSGDAGAKADWRQLMRTYKKDWVI